jgi:hypothetical protein
MIIVRLKLTALVMLQSLRKWCTRESQLGLGFVSKRSLQSAAPRYRPVG